MFSIASQLRRSSSHAGRPLDDVELQRLVPSAFAAEAHSSRSARYAHIPTSDVIAGMRAAGFVPTFATQAITRDESKQGHAKHLIRFRREGEAPAVGGLYPEICLVNSHDGSSAYQLYSGLFRLVCANGLMTGDRYEAARIRHSGNPIREVIDASFTVIEDSRRAVTAADTMGRLLLSRDERQVLAEAAHTLRFDGAELGEAISAERLLRPRRADDTRTDLFSTLNVLQENVIRGGIAGHQVDPATRRARRVSTRAVKGIDQNTALNRALWTLAERMAELKAA